MKIITRYNDKAINGGKILSGYNVIKLEWVGIARNSRTVIYLTPHNGRTAIAEGHPTFKDNSVPLAFHRHRFEHRCTLISSLPQASAS